jgi:hypothetical protein
MLRLTPLAVALLLTLGVVAASAHTSTATGAAAKDGVCAQGTKRAVIGGRVRCLRIGMQCDTRFNTTKPSYRTYGFLCSSWYTVAPKTLFRIAQPGPAPATCAGIEATPSSAHPGSESAWVGSSPLWLGPYLDWRSDAAGGIWHYRYTTGLRDQNGWGVKFLWQLLDTAGPTRISFTDIGRETPVMVILSGSYVERSTAPVLDPAKPNHPAQSDQHPGAGEWGSTVLFPQAGCYRLDAQWSQGSTSIVFSFGQ